MADRHAAHDPLLVAALAGGDLEAADRTAAEALVAGCPECAAVASDLVAIARATAGMPTPRRPRDFFVSAADARRLRPRGLRGMAAAIVRPRVETLRPLAGALMTLGLAGLVVASLPGLSQFGAAPAANERLELTSSPAPDSAIQGEPLVPYASAPPAASQAGDTRGGAGQGASAPPDAVGPPGASAPAERSKGAGAARNTATGPSPLVVGSVALVSIGALLLLASLPGFGPRRS